MPDAISNTSPLLYLYRGGVLEWLPELFSEIWIPNAIILELQEGRRRGYDVPDPGDYGWLKFVEPRSEKARIDREHCPPYRTLEGHWYVDFR